MESVDGSSVDVGIIEPVEIIKKKKIPSAEVGYITPNEVIKIGGKDKVEAEEREQGGRDRRNR